jgi:aspartokinase-like uncharacterized kinase
MSAPAARPSRPAVVKIGGSLVESGAARDALRELCRFEVPFVVVPGGGAFADAVRHEQRRLGFDDDAAHRMAMLAMEQTAWLLASFEPRLVVADTEAAIDAALARGRIPAWAPLRMADGDPTLPRDWTTTSDALAAWLAVHLGSPLVVLLKSVPVDAGQDAAALAEEGVVDPVFARIVAAAGLDFVVLGPGEEDRLPNLLGARAGAKRVSA